MSDLAIRAMMQSLLGGSTSQEETLLFSELARRLILSGLNINSSGTINVTIAVFGESILSLSDNTTNDVTSTKHGFAPKSPADATKFLNGAATPAFAAVKDSDLSTTDVTTNDVTSTKHGFAPKSPALSGQFLNGAATPAFAYPVFSVAGSTTTGATNNWAPTLLGHTLIEWNGALDAAMTGLDGGITGQIVTIKNITTTKIITFAHASGSSDVDNRFTNLATSAATPVAPGGWISYQHDGTNWKLVGHEQGAYITPTFAAGDFTGNGSMTWTVASGDVSIMRYRLCGKTLTVSFNVITSTVGGTLNNSLRIGNGQWGGFTAAAAETNPVVILDNGAIPTGVPIATTSTTLIALSVSLATPNWAAATDATYVRGQITFEVT